MAAASEGMPGTLVLVVGPSGSGKDTLIRAARGQLACDSSYLFVRRVITRGIDANEDHEVVTDDEFSSREDRGEFALSWSAHGLRYGVPSSIASAIATGTTVICNVSRTVVDFARSRFRFVVVIEISAPVETLAARLSRRARETVEDQTARLQRSLEVPVACDVRIGNTGSVEQGAALLVAVIERSARGLR